MSSSSFSHRIKKLPHRIFNQIVQCCNSDGRSEDSAADDIPSHVLKNLLSKKINMEFIFEMKQAFQGRDSIHLKHITRNITNFLSKSYNKKIKQFKKLVCVALDNLTKMPLLETN